MLNVSRKELNESFNRHYSLYKQLSNNSSVCTSAYLLLFYAVECGLKNKILHNDGGQIWPGNSNDNHNVGHDIQSMLKRLKVMSNYKFTMIYLPSGDCIAVKQLHEVWRYGIKIKKSCNQAISQNIKVLEEIAKWIDEQ